VPYQCLGHGLTDLPGSKRRPTLWAARTRLGTRGKDDDGFTLIELMVVVLIIAILLAIAIPTFMGARQKAQDRAAQTNLRTGLTAIRTAYVDGQSYLTAASQLATIEPTLRFISTSGASSSGQGEIAVNAVDDQNVGMAALAADGVCWQLFDSTASDTAGTTYGSVPHRTATTCTAPGAALSAKSW
jgi:type IV pilus assembly protein PilA